MLLWQNMKLVDCMRSFAYVNMAKQDQLKKKKESVLNLQSHLVSTLYSRAHQASCAPCALPPATAAHCSPDHPTHRVHCCCAKPHAHHVLAVLAACSSTTASTYALLLRPHLLARWHTRPAHTAAATAIPAHVSAIAPIATAPIAIATATIATPAIAIAPATLTAPPGPHDRWPRPGVSPPKPERHADHAQPTGGCLAKHRAR